VSRRWSVGDVRITQVVEIESSSPASFLFGDALTPERLARHAWLRPHHVDERGRLRGSIHCFVVESRGRRIAVDTCVGNDKTRSIERWHRRQGAFLADLAAAGFAPATIDTVLCTHLHVDHVGWNTRWVDGRWVPTFPNARYLFGRAEWAYWSGATDADDAHDPAQVLEDSVRPVFDAGLAVLVETDHRITDEVVLEPTPGHTPGHVSVRIASRGAEAVITGDLMHHPVQCCDPSLGSRFDWDPGLARRTRLAFLQHHAARGTLVLGTHFAPPTGGWLAARGEGWELVDAAPAPAHAPDATGASSSSSPRPV
jgi:glyoxylase-like metal-dependent hydrolase (beta-lactamase superfamily II)